MGERRLLRFAQVVEHRAGGADRRRRRASASKPKPSSERVPKCFGERCRCGVVAEGPGGAARDA